MFCKAAVNGKTNKHAFFEDIFGNVYPFKTFSFYLKRYRKTGILPDVHNL